MVDAGKDSRRRIRRMVLRTVVITHGLAFLFGLIGFVVVLSGMDNSLAQTAWQEQGGMMLLQHAAYLPAYVLIAAVTFLLIHPVVRRWARRERSTRRIVAATLLLLLGFHGFFALRLLSLHPIDLGGVFASVYGTISSILSGGRWTRIPSSYFDVTTIVVAGLAAVYYFVFLLRAFLRTRRATRWITASSVGLLAAGTLYAAVPATGGPTPDDARTDKPYNILILSSDSLRGDRLSCNGYSRATSPRIDELAGKSVNFTRAFVPTASTTESWVSLLTGQYPHTHKLRHMFPNARQVREVESNSPWLPKILAERGYRTAAMGDWAGSVFNAMDMGYKETLISELNPQSFEMYVTEAVLFAHPLVPLYFNNEVGFALFPNIETSMACLNTEALTRRVIRKLGELDRGSEPFLLSVFYGVTHLPYGGTWPYNEMFTDPDYEGPNRYKLEFGIDDFIQNGFRDDYTPAQIQHILDLYDGEVFHFDENIGRILDHLDRTGLMENTIVLITSDHGDDLFEPHCTIGHGVSFKGGDQNNHIPQVLYIPDRRDEPRQVDRIVRSLDVTPTLLDLLGLPIPVTMDGRSLMPYITGQTDDMGLVFFGETSYLFYEKKAGLDEDGELPLYYDPMDKTLRVDKEYDNRLVLKDAYQDLVVEVKDRVIRTENWKLVLTPGQKVRYELYDLQEDPNRSNNLLDATGQPKNEKWVSIFQQLRPKAAEKRATYHGERYELVFELAERYDILKMFRTDDLRNERNLLRNGRPIDPAHDEIFQRLYHALQRWRGEQVEALCFDEAFVFDSPVGSKPAPATPQPDGG